MDRPLVLGIINITPDSFYSGSRSANHSDLLFRAEKMIAQGAAILDIGGQSTRPGSTLIPAEQEMDRVLPAIELIHQAFPEQIISVDTFYAAVARAAVLKGAHMVNDVSAGSMDDALLDEVAALKVPYVLMHMPGTPQTMLGATYTNVTVDLFDFFSFKMKELIHKGIKDIIIDIGFGFGKTAQQNFELLRNLSFFKSLRLPIMVGLSRKATIYKTLNITPEEALNGTSVLHTIALLNGAAILRVHDVKEAMEAVKLFSAYQSEPAPGQSDVELRNPSGQADASL